MDRFRDHQWLVSISVLVSKLNLLISKNPQWKGQGKTRLLPCCIHLSTSIHRLWKFRDQKWCNGEIFVNISATKLLVFITIYPKYTKISPQGNIKAHLSLTKEQLWFRALEAMLVQQGGREPLKISLFIILKDSVPVFYSACLPQAQWSSVGGTVRTKNSCCLLMWFDIEKLTQNFRSGV